MDDEMKEPNSEQTPSASDEQKPNIEGKQVSDGADDTTSPDDRSSNEDGATCNKEEDDLLLTSAINKLGGNKRAAIATAAIVAVIFCLPMLFPQMFCTHKLWTNANCTSPRTCKSCGKTEGKPLGHEWEEATCTVPKTCQRCGKTEGKPLGHQPGSWTTEVDYVDATSKEIRECGRCGEVVDTRNEKEITSFLGDGSFSISPEGFIERLNEEFSDIPNCSSMKASYELDDSGTGLELQIKMALRLPVLEVFLGLEQSTTIQLSWIRKLLQKHSHVLRKSDYAAATALATIQAIDPTLSFPTLRRLALPA